MHDGGGGGGGGRVFTSNFSMDLLLCLKFLYVQILFCIVLNNVLWQCIYITQQ